MKNSLADLNAYLFEELDRLSNEDMTEEQLRAEIDRSNAMTKVAERVIESADITLKALKLNAEMGPGAKLPKLLDGGGEG